MRCKRCGTDTPRLTADQRYCPDCVREVAAILDAQRAREQGRPVWMATAKDMTGMRP